MSLALFFKVQRVSWNDGLNCVPLFFFKPSFVNDVTNNWPEKDNILEMIDHPSIDENQKIY